MLCTVSFNIAANSHRTDPSSSCGTEMLVDEAIERLGRYGPWQISLFIVLGLVMGVTTSYGAMSVIFVGAIPAHMCKTSENSSHIVADQCQEIYVNASGNVTVPCQHGWTYDHTYYGSTIVTQWNLVCDDLWMVDFSQTLYIIGMALGTVLLMPLADKYGRKPTVIYGTLVLVVTWVISAFSVNYIMFAAFRVIQGLITIAIGFASYVLACELFPASRRTYAGLLVQVFWVTSLMLLLCLAYFMRDWRHLHLAISFLPIIILPGYWLIPESIPWLVANGKPDEAIAILKKAARFNRISLHVTSLENTKQDELDINDGEDEENLPEKYKHHHNDTICTVIRHPVTRKYTIILAWTWFVDAIAYFGLSFTATSLSGDPYINFCLTAMVELPAIFIAVFFLEKYGRRLPIFAFHLLAGIALLVTIFVPSKTSGGTDLGIVILVLNLIGKTFVTAGYDSINLYTPELFPTNLRNTGLAVCNVSSRIGAMIAPFSTYVIRIIPWLPGVIIGAMCVVAGILALCLPETHDKPFPQTLDEMLAWKNTNNRCFCNSEQSESTDDERQRLLHSNSQILDELAINDEEDEKNRPEKYKHHHKDTFCTVIRHPVTRKYTIILAWTWFVDAFAYYGLSFTATALSGDPYINFCLTAMVELPAIFTALFFLEKYGRRLPIFAFHLLAGIALLVTMFVPNKTSDGTDLGIVILVLNLIGKTFVTAGYDSIYLFTAELFPTNLRNTGSAVCNVSSRIGAMIAPFSTYVIRIIPWLPGVIFGAMCVADVYNTWNTVCYKSIRVNLGQIVSQIVSQAVTGLICRFQCGTEMLVDEAIESLGRYGPWQILLYVVLGLVMALTTCFGAMSVIFVGAIPVHRCKITENSSHIFADQCQEIYVNASGNKTVPCQHGWTYDHTYYRSTIVTEWNLVCDDLWMVDFSQTLYIIGMALGTVLLMPLADKYGRKPTVIYGTLVLVVTWVISAFSVNYIMFAAFRVIHGLITIAVGFATYVLACELFPASRRTYAGILVQVFWALSLLLLLCLAYFIRNWRHLNLVMGLLPIIILPGYWLIPESIPWLVANGKPDEAIAILKKAARCNRISLHVTSLENFKEDELAINDEEDEENLPEKYKHHHKDTFCTVIRHPVTRKYTIILAWTWFVDAIAYFGLSFTATSLSGDPYINFCLTALVEIPAIFIALFLLERYGRRLPTSAFHLLAGIALLVTIFVPNKTSGGTDLGIVILVLNLIGKSFVSAAYDSMYLYTPELFPTNLRNTGLGVCNVTSRIGAMIAPFSTYVIQIIPWLPGVIIGAICVVAGILILCLPETHDKPFPQTLDEMLAWKNTNNRCFCSSKQSAENIEEERQHLLHPDSKIQ
ncbi:uncharacterized protein LOC141915059 [Tubulanus polymorphus]|uniref:uncharacterized protein LOC141915059 n=1 Tax=Tubulanus polymorphus TaxID=672921 RepID=UPI003DA22C3A